MGTQEKVLIVEDEENERSGLSELVSAWGYRTETAKDGLDGKKGLRRGGRREAAVPPPLERGLVGVLGAVLASIILAKAPPRYLFLVGILPALLVLWIRKAVPEPEEWTSAKKAAVERHHHPLVWIDYE